MLTQVTANGLKLTHASQEEDINDSLNTKDAITNIKIGGSRKIVVTTKSQIYIWKLDNINTPQVFQLPRNLGQDNIQILLSTEDFVILNHELAIVFNYEGRQKCQIRFQRGQNLTLPPETALSKNFFYVLNTDGSLHAFDLVSGSHETGKNVVFKSMPAKLMVSHMDEVAYIDENSDVYFIMNGAHHKILSGAKDARFSESDGADSLIVLCENKVVEFLTPGLIIRNDVDLLNGKTYILSQSYSSVPTSISSYRGEPMATVILQPNSIHIKTSPWTKIFTKKTKIDGLLRLCQLINERTLWCSLACLSLEKNDVGTTQLAYAALEKVDKIDFINDNTAVPDVSLQEAQLLNQNKLLQALYLNVKHSRWDRALSLSVSNKQHIDLVMALRERYLESLELEEDNDRFLQVQQQVRWNWDEVRNRISELESF